MDVRLQVTAMPVEVEPGVTRTESVVALPAVTGFGLAEPTPEREMAPPCGVSEKSSTARPSSAPVASWSFQRIQKVAPLGMLSELIVLERAVRSAAALPFLAPAVTVSGVTKLSAATLIQVPVTRSVELRLYSKFIWSVRPAVPRRHCSPLYATAKDVIGEPVLFVKHAPKFG